MKAESCFENWDQFYMNMVYLVSLKSKDPATKQGAVIVSPHNRVVSIGYNGFPRGSNDDVPERYERPEKYLWFEHAERNAIYNAERPLIGCTLYTCGLSCVPCARGIIQVGISEVVFDIEWWEKDMLYAKEQGTWESELDRTIEMYSEVGIMYRSVKIKEFLKPERHRRGEIF